MATSNTLKSITLTRRNNSMKVTTKGQVTIPLHIREKYGISSNSEVEFIDEDGNIYLVKKKNNHENSRKRFREIRGTATVKMSTDEIMALTRGNN